MADKKQAPKPPVVGEPSKADPIEDVQKGFENWCKANPDSDYCYVRPEDRKKAGGKVMRSNMEKQTKYRKGGMCKSKKMASGGKVRGCGAAKRGVKKAKMY
jgi:hypothetical protein